MFSVYDMKVKGPSLINVHMLYGHWYAFVSNVLVIVC